MRRTQEFKCSSVSADGTWWIKFQYTIFWTYKVNKKGVFNLFWWLRSKEGVWYLTLLKARYTEQRAMTRRIVYSGQSETCLLPRQTDLSLFYVLLGCVNESIIGPITLSSANHGCSKERSSSLLFVVTARLWLLQFFLRSETVINGFMIIQLIRFSTIHL